MKSIVLLDTSSSLSVGRITSLKILKPDYIFIVPSGPDINLSRSLLRQSFRLTGGR